MRAAIILPVTAITLSMTLAACQVSTDDANDSTTVQYNQDLAENVAEDVSNQAGAIAGYIANDVKEAGETVKNEVGDINVDVDVSRDKPATANAN